MILHKIKNFEKLKNTYLLKLTKGNNPKKRLSNISVGTQTQNEIIDFLLKNYDNIILGTPYYLMFVINHFESKGWHNEIFKIVKRKPIPTNFGNEILKNFAYNSFRKCKSKGLWLAEMLGIKVCPYCNAQYTLIIYTNGSAKVKFQFDHFFSIKRYPYFSLSIYNLIPSCSSCNLSKGDKLLDLNNYYHPFNSDINSLSKFSLSSTSVINEYIGKHKLDIEFNSIIPENMSFVNTHNLLYGIEGIYRQHSDIAEDLVNKSIYMKNDRRGLYKNKKLFPDDSTYFRYLIGNYHLHEDISKRPLAKFMQDIAREVGLL